MVSLLGNWSKITCEHFWVLAQRREMFLMLLQSMKIYEIIHSDAVGFKFLFGLNSWRHNNHISDYIGGIYLSSFGHFLTRYLQRTKSWAQHLTCPDTRKACCCSLSERMVNLHPFAYHCWVGKLCPTLSYHTSGKGDKKSTHCLEALSRSGLHYSGHHRPRQQGNVF